MPVRARVAQAFHEEYEELAKLYGWTTREASARPWAEVPVNQRALMVHTIGNLEARGIITITEEGAGPDERGLPTPVSDPTPSGLGSDQSSTPDGPKSRG